VVVVVFVIMKKVMDPNERQSSLGGSADTSGETR